MANFNYSHYVCDCKKVTLGEVVCAIEEKNANTIESIKELTDAGTACGCCVCPEDDFGNPKMDLYLVDVLKKFKK